MWDSLKNSQTSDYFVFNTEKKIKFFYNLVLIFNVQFLINHVLLIVMVHVVCIHKEFFA